MDFLQQDYRWMAEAIRLAKKGINSTSPNPNVGCVLVKNDQIVGSGWHEKAGLAHAEVMALKTAEYNAKGTDCYVTLEPCCHQGKTGPCAHELITAGVRRVYVAMKDPNPQVAGKGIEKLLQAGIEVYCGLLEEEARKLNPGFIKRMLTGMPYVRCKIGSSLDGKMALGNGKSQWITSEFARQDVQKFRARSSAILTGINTVLADDPQLNIRGIDCKGRQALRVVLDSQMRMPQSARMFNLPGKTLIFTLKAESEYATGFVNAKIISVTEDNGRVSLRECLQYLASQEQANEVLVEAGPTLTGALIQEQLIDELLVYMSGKILGDHAQSLFQLPQFDKLQEVPEFEFIDVRKLSDNLRLSLKPLN